MPRYTHHLPALLVFALLMAGLAAYHRRKGWKLIFTDEWHTMSRGKSHLSRLLPFLSEDTIQRKLEPALCWLAGLLLMGLSSALGLWIMFCSAALAVWEALVHEAALNEMLDRHDARVEAKAAKQVDAIVTNGGRPKAISVGQSSGSPCRS